MGLRASREFSNIFVVSSVSWVRGCGLRRLFKRVVASRNCTSFHIDRGIDKLFRRDQRQRELFHVKEFMEAAPAWVQAVALFFSHQSRIADLCQRGGRLIVSGFLYLGRRLRQSLYRNGGWLWAGIRQRV